MPVVQSIEAAEGKRGGPNVKRDKPVGLSRFGWDSSCYPDRTVSLAASSPEVNPIVDRTRPTTVIYDWRRVNLRLISVLLQLAFARALPSAYADGGGCNETGNSARQ